MGASGFLSCCDPGGMQGLDVPSIDGRSRAGSATTVSSSGLLTTPSSGSIFGGESRASSSISFMVRERLHSLARDINRRTNVMKQHIQQPPTPDSVSLSSSVGDELGQIEQADKGSLYSFGSHYSRSLIGQPLPDESAPSDQPTSTETPKTSSASAMLNRIRIQILPYSIDSQSKTYLVWLFIVSACFLYNAYAIPLRYSFPYQTKWNLPYWLMADYFCDVIYLIDMTVFMPRLRFMRDGLPVLLLMDELPGTFITRIQLNQGQLDDPSVTSTNYVHITEIRKWNIMAFRRDLRIFIPFQKDRSETRKHYLCGWYFKLDLLSLLPLDIFYLIPAVGVNPMLRLSRLFKFRCYVGMFRMLDSAVKNPYALRIGKTLSYMVYMIHCNGCIYYSLSNWEGIASSPWTYNGRGNMYLRCFYFAAKLATSVGNNPDPTNFIEYIYMTICWMLGVFVFALLLGQIRDIVATANKNKEIFRKTMDAALDYCTALNLPKETRDKVRLWFIYTWQEQKTLNENMLLEKLPLKLRTDLAISVHYQVLSKVQLFQDCDKALLRDLVLKLKPVLYLPGDYVCRKGEVGKEMYIVNKGVVEVVGGPHNDVVFATLREGSVFGEISLLALAGGNRRTADVRSKGFSNLFVLSKQDLNETIKDYPEAQRILKRKAKKLIKSDAEKTEKKPQKEIEMACTVGGRASTPKLLPVVAQVLDPSTSAGKLLRMVLDDDASRRKKSKRTTSRASHASDASSIVEDVMSGMPIDQVIQIHQESYNQTRKQSESTDSENNDPLHNNGTFASNRNEGIQVVDETKNECTVEPVEQMQQANDFDEANSVNIKVTQTDKGEEANASRRTLFHSSSSDENRLTVPTMFTGTHGALVHRR